MENEQKDQAKKSSRKKKPHKRTKGSGCLYQRGRVWWMKDFRVTWKAACDEAGVPGLKVHDLRRTGIRNMIRRGVPENIAMQISGHKTVSVFRRYNIISDADLRNAARQIEAGRAPQFTDTVQPSFKTEGTTVN